jgi:hypothetical protein
LSGGSSLYLAGQRRTEPEIVDGACPRLDEVGAGSLCPIHGELPKRHLQQAPADMPPRPDQRRQGADRADRLAATGMTLQRYAEAND